MIIQDLTKKQLSQLKTLPRGKKTEIQKNTGVSRSTINNMIFWGTASEETVKKVFDYLNKTK